MAGLDDLARMRAQLLAERRQQMQRAPQQMGALVGQGADALNRMAEYLRRKDAAEAALNQRAAAADSDRRARAAVEAAKAKALQDAKSAALAETRRHHEATEDISRGKADWERERFSVKQALEPEMIRRKGIEAERLLKPVEPRPGDEDMPEGDEEPMTRDDLIPEDLSALEQREQAAEDRDLERRRKEKALRKGKGGDSGKPRRAKHKELEAWTEAARMESRLSGIAGLSENVKTGRLREGVAKVAKTLGLPVDADFARVRARVMSEVNAAMKAMSGAAVSESEMERLQAVMPMPDDNPETFLIKLEEWVSQIHSTRLTEEFRLEQAGIEVPSYGDFSARLSPGATAAPGTPGGDRKQRLREAFKKNPKLKQDAARLMKQGVPEEEVINAILGAE